MEMEQTRSRFAVEHLESFLWEVHCLVDGGFEEDQIRLLQTTAEVMRIDSSKSFEFPVRFNGSKTLLAVTLFMGENEIPEVTFLTHPNLARAIGEQAVLFFQEITR